MKFLLVGLGNIGEEYRYTRHNIGFLVLDRMINKYQTEFKSGKLADTATFRIKNKVVTAIKPTTYMNLSGKSYRYWLEQLDVPVEQSMAVVDELALQFGTIRIKTKGSSGGHNGLASIEQELKTAAYARLRFGIGNSFSKGKQIDYVLGKWSDEEVKALPELLDKTILAIEESILSGFSNAMNKFNG
jgi:PTH1 family peptidyl-tRNA hydrolase